MPESTATVPSSRPQLPTNFSNTCPPTLVYQGAEALVYKTTFPLPSSSNLPTYLAALKHRPRKPYRHPTLDARLTRHRILTEARVLLKLRREAEGPTLHIPAVYALDWEAGWMLSEWIEGRTVRGVLEDWLRAEPSEQDTQERALREMMGSIGRAVGQVHKMGVVHGDLTTSNMMVRDREGLALTLIDFGLANTTDQFEDRAVDLYVLERAFGSTHPRAAALFEEVLKAYGESHKNGKAVLKRLEEVRLRGRKRSMVG